ncbi:MAG TPA: hypothetical protein EYH34_08890 [Planctomycetes bacterium]|nr:hypothetical protein [Planctomycetota bacterium]
MVAELRGSLAVRTALAAGGPVASAVSFTSRPDDLRRAYRRLSGISARDLVETWQLWLRTRLFAPTRDRGKEMAEELLKILDYGLSGAKQRESLRRKARYEPELARKQRELAAGNEEWAELQGKIKGTEP